MLRTLICLIFFSTTSYLFAQVSDDFSDGDLTNDPAWLGDVSHFKVNAAGQLQLMAPAAGTSSLYLPVEIADSNYWACWIQMDFSPSNSNNLRIYLMADGENLTDANGYFILLGKDGSNDAIEFYRQDGGTATLLAAGTPAAIAVNPTLRLRMSRFDGTTWNLEVNYSGGTQLKTEFTVEDDTWKGGSHFFGFVCNYTSTRTDKFFFDDAAIAPIVPDTLPPSLLSAKAIDSLHVLLHFDEELDTANAKQTDHYLLDGGIGMPIQVQTAPNDPASVLLTLPVPLVSQSTYTVTAKDISDLQGNTASALTATFTYLKIEPAAAYEVLIDEIMADPTPSVGLPAAEYVELYNRSQKIIDLEGFGFSNGSTTRLLPSFLLFPGAYVILCDKAHETAFATFGKVLPIDGMPTLTNSEDELFLLDPAGNLVHAVHYALADYGNSSKQEGGWSLELVNPEAPCRIHGNWRASINLLGGTPGQPNSVLNPLPDLTPPIPHRVYVSADNPNQVLVFFDEALLPESAEDLSHYTLVGGPGLMEAMLVDRHMVALILDEPLMAGTPYELIVEEGIADCIGNESKSTFYFDLALPEPALPGDVVINELLFNPYSGGSDFVELYNRSERAIDLSKLFIGNLDPTSDTVIVDIDLPYLMLPGEYAVLTPDTAYISSQYTVLNPQALLRQTLPPFNDKSGNVSLYRLEGSQVLFIDTFDYEESMHHPLLDDVEGVSLERIHPDAPSNLPSSWHSAAQAAGFATPTYQNSQFIELGLPTKAVDIALNSKTFSPDGDGFEDFLLITFQADIPGYTARIHIYDLAGRLVKRLVNNELLGTNGFFRWDGDTDDGSKAPVGVYIIWLQLFHPTEAKTITEKRVCVLAGRLD